MPEIQALTDDELWDQLDGCFGARRAEILCELARRAMDSYAFQRADIMLEEAATNARGVSCTPLQAEIASARAVVASHLGDVARALSLFEASARIYMDLEDLHAAAQALLNKARLELMCDQFEVAASTARDARRIADEDSIAGETALLEAQAAWECGEAQSALDACTFAEAHFRRAQDLDKGLEVANLRITLLVELGHLKDAQVAASALLSLAPHANQRARVHLRLAEILTQRGRTKKALHQSDQALTAYRALESWLAVAECQELRAQIFHLLGRRRKAQKALRQARALFDANGCYDSVLRTQMKQAMFLQSAGKHAKAAKVNRQLIQVLAQDDDYLIEAQCSAVRLLECLVGRGREWACCEAAEEWTKLWTEDITAADPGYRAFLGVWTIALDRTGRTRQALATANHILKASVGDPADPAVTWAYDVRGRNRLTEGHPGAERDLAHAINGHLALHQHADAAHLAALLSNHLDQLAAD